MTSTSETEALFVQPLDPPKVKPAGHGPTGFEWIGWVIDWFAVTPMQPPKGG